MTDLAQFIIALGVLALCIGIGLAAVIWSENR